MKPLWTAVVALGLAGAAWADDELPLKLNDRDAKVAELEARLRFLESQQDDAETIRKLKEAAAREKVQEAEELPARVSKIEKQMSSAGQTWDASKMLTFSTPDGNFTAKIGGRIYFDYRHIFDREDSTVTPGAAGSAGQSGGAPDTFWVDTARIQLDGTFFKNFIYRVEAEAKSGENATGTTNVPAAFRTKDIYLGFTIGDALTIRGGQMKMPFSQEETCSSRFVDFAERSVMNRWIPAHDQGILINGALFDKVFEWTVGVMNEAVTRDAGKGSVASQDDKWGVGRLFVSPFRNGSSFAKTLRVGFDFFMGDVDNIAQGDITSGDLGGVTMTDFLTTNVGGASIVDGMRTGMNFSFSWAYGPISLRGEYAIIKQELLDDPLVLESEYEVTMYNAAITWLVTGEEKVVENRIKPKYNLDPMNGGWGAFEIAVRVAGYEVGDEVNTTGAAAAQIMIPATSATANTNLKVQEVTVGLNWWWSPNVVVRFNYEMLKFDEDLLNIKTGGEAEDSQDVFIVRWQIDF